MSRLAWLLVPLLLGCSDRSGLEVFGSATSEWRQDNLLVVHGTLEIQTNNLSSTPVLSSLTVRNVTDGMGAADSAGFDVDLEIFDRGRVEPQTEGSTDMKVDFVASGRPVLDGAAACPTQLFLVADYVLEADDKTFAYSVEITASNTCVSCASVQPATSNVGTLGVPIGSETELLSLKFHTLEQVVAHPDGAIWLVTATDHTPQVFRVRDGSASSLSLPVSRLAAPSGPGIVGAADTGGALQLTRFDDSGMQVWSHAISSAHADPKKLAASNGRVLVFVDPVEAVHVDGDEVGGAGPQLLAFDEDTGELTGLLPSFAVTAVTAAGADAWIIAGNELGAPVLRAIDPDLATAWSVDPGLDTQGAILASDDVSGDVFIYSPAVNTVAAFDQDGQLRWSSVIDGPPLTSIAPLSNGELLASAETGAVRLTSTGEVATWSTPLMSEPWCAPEEVYLFGAGGARTVFLTAGRLGQDTVLAHARVGELTP